MPIRAFPDPSAARSDGLLAVGGDLHPDSLVLAYRNGIFPWPVGPRAPLPWFCPPERALLEHARLHLSRSLRGARNRASRANNEGGLRFTVDAAFEQVIDRCAHVPRLDEDGDLAGTWITPAMIRAYTRLHALGHAHSVEAWEGDELVAGIYGVSVDGTFSAESMFHLRPNASKLALVHLVEHVAARGLGWIDVQVMTPHVERLGARMVPRDEFLALLRRTQALGLRPFA